MTTAEFAEFIELCQKSKVSSPADEDEELTFQFATPAEAARFRNLLQHLANAIVLM